MNRATSRCGRSSGNGTRAPTTFDTVNCRSRRFGFTGSTDLPGANPSPKIVAEQPSDDYLNYSSAVTPDIVPEGLLIHRPQW